MNEQDKIPLSEIVNALTTKPQYVLVIVAENQNGRQRVVHCDLREYDEALAIYDGVNRYLRGEA